MPQGMQIAPGGVPVSPTTRGYELYGRRLSAMALQITANVSVLPVKCTPARSAATDEGYDR